ncbi:phosphatidate cytidylyltransferase [Treponema pectinovorum]|uniref:phosphatidate cytidylyltransferase n=1 Tax=Treponema pectinovorum TaxID=164 RepID=UPI003D91FC66
MNSKVISRLCIFFIGIPVIIALIVLNQFNHLALHAVITMAAILASSEFYHILSHNFKLQKKYIIIPLTCFIHLVMFARAIFVFDFSFVYFSYIASLLLCLTIEVIFSKTFEDSNHRIASSFLILTYIGLLFTFLSRMTFFEHSRQILITFFTMVFFCDSLAWFFGVLFGKNNKGFIKASPNKSIAGFCGGIFGSILSGVLCYHLWSDIFTGSILKIILLGVLISLTSIIGDLVESVFKRSSQCKDSGSIIPGRGGILDSIDSIIFSAPVFYFAITHIYKNL